MKEVEKIEDPEVSDEVKINGRQSIYTNRQQSIIPIVFMYSG
jgi:hypothetical protein